MNKSDCFELGFITKSHGLDGKVQAIFDVENPMLFSELDAIFLEQKNSLVPFFIEKIEHLDANKFHIKFEDINTKDESASLKGTKLFLHLDFLPELEDGKHYLHDLLNFSVFDRDKGYIGTAIDFVDSGPQTILVVLLGEKEILIPYHEDLIDNIDEKKKQITMDLPSGLVELYLNDEA